MTISFARPKTKTYVNIERLEDLDEVWSFCFRVPKPGWRILGRFTHKDHFVGLRAYDRSQLAGRGYSVAARETISDWDNIIGIDPIKSETISDYISGPVYDVAKKL